MNYSATFYKYFTTDTADNNNFDVGHVTQIKSQITRAIP